MMVARVWRKHALRPHRLEGYMASNDPDFETKAAYIIGLYLHPPQHAGAAIGWPWFLSLLAEACMDGGRVEEALCALTEARAIVNEHEERYLLAEINRLLGELLLKQNNSSAVEAENCLRRAIEIARDQSAKSWELRATTSLARLIASQGRRDEARTILADIYNWFTEGFDTADLKDAKVLLDELAG
jgi:predicted ATPase